VLTAARRRFLAECAVLLAAALLLSFGIRAYVLQDFSVPSTSMEPTLDVNDRFLVQKAFFSWHDVHQGDIVVFARPRRDTECGSPSDTYLVKRVVATGGQTIYSAGRALYVDGRRLAEPYLPGATPPGPPVAARQQPFRVPPGEFYVMGDNRGISCDSRYWGPISGTSIVGKAVLRWWRNGHPGLHSLTPG
jgi:signal peptidase I